jgi:ComEC/Rec2-related protein
MIIISFKLFSMPFFLVILACLLILIYLFRSYGLIFPALLWIVLFIRKSPPVNDDIINGIESRNPVTIRIQKQHIDWKQDIKLDGTILYENKWYPAAIYGDIGKIPSSVDNDSIILPDAEPIFRQTCDLYNPRITGRKFKNSYRISITLMDNSYVIRKPKKTFSMEKYLENIREVIRSILLNNNELRNGFIACGLFLGEKQMIPEPIQRRINGSGISHLFAVSGLHVGFIVLLFTGLLKQLSVSNRIQLVLICLFSFFYALLTPFSSSVFRTVLMLMLSSISRLCNRKIHILHIVFFSALIMLTLNPVQITQVGFWFSYMAVLGILIFYPILSAKFQFENTLIRYIWDMILVSCSATWGILPAGIMVFGTVSTLAVFLNIVMIPLVFLMLGTIIAKLLTAFIPFFSQCISWVYSFLSAIFFSILETVHPYSDYLVYNIRNIPVTGCFWLIGILLFFKIPRKRIHQLYVYSAIILISCTIPGINRFIAVSSEADNSLFIVDRKKVLMINGTGMNSFDTSILKRFRLQGRKPDILIVTDTYHNSIKNILTLQKRYSGLKVLVPEPCESVECVTVLRDTSFSYGKMQISIIPKNHRFNVYIQKEKLIAGVLEYPPALTANLYLSRKKYSEKRSGTDKFLTVRMIRDHEEMKAIMKNSNPEESFKIW